MKLFTPDLQNNKLTLNKLFGLVLKTDTCNGIHGEEICLDMFSLGFEIW